MEVKAAAQGLLKRTSAFIWSKIAEREREGEREGGEPRVMETKVITPGKIVPHKCCLPSSNFSMKKDFDRNVF